MKLLLDENLPKRLKRDFSEHEIYTVRDRGWNGITNGELLRLMIGESFEAFFTFDKNLQHQQNFRKYSIPVLVLNADENTYATLQKLVPAIKEVLMQPLSPGPTEIK